MGLIEQAHSHAVIYSCWSQNDISTGACLARLHNAFFGHVPSIEIDVLRFSDVQPGGRGGGGLAIVAYAGKLHTKGVPFLSLQL